MSEPSLVRLQNRVQKIRDRLDAARERGQVELHLDLEDVEILVCSTEAFFEAHAAARAANAKTKNT